MCQERTIRNARHIATCAAAAARIIAGMRTLSKGRRRRQPGHHVDELIDERSVAFPSRRFGAEHIEGDVARLLGSIRPVGCQRVVDVCDRHDLGEERHR